MGHTTIQIEVLIPLTGSDINFICLGQTPAKVLTKEFTLGVVETDLEMILCLGNYTGF